MRSVKIPAWTSLVTVLCDPARGIFPGSGELELSCSCPDGARLCKHLAAVLYGVGARLDQAPELLFTLRGVELEELAAGQAGARAGRDAPAAAFTDAELAELFGIELGGSPASQARARKPRASRAKAGRARRARKRTRRAR